MRPAARLVLACVLFAGWLGYLGYLVYNRPRTPSGQPLVLSRPQFLESRLDVVADVPDPKEPVTIEQVLFPEQGAPVKPGDKITVEGLDKCHPLPRESGNGAEPPPDWTGPGRYILPLVPEGGRGVYEVARIPPSPGFPPGGRAARPPRIYPATAESLAEYRRDILPHKPR